jgi:excisionase family DNA binding protein
MIAAEAMQKSNKNEDMNHIDPNPSSDVYPLALTSLQAAKALGISPRTLWGLTKQGHIPHVRLGKSVRYPCDVLRDWLAKQAVGGGAAPFAQSTGIEDGEKIKSLKSNDDQERMASWQAL